MASRVNTLRATQAEATRQRILDAAERCFVLQAFAGTRIDDIASEAGVAVPTVYKTFVNKKNVLFAVLERAMTGTHVGGPVEEQAWWVEQIEEPDPGRQLDLIARNARQIYERAAPILEVVRAAAPLDDDIADVWERLSTERLERGKKSARRFAAKAGKRVALGTGDIAVTRWVLTGPELYVAQASVDRRPSQYEALLAHVLRASLLDQPNTSTTPASPSIRTR